MDSLCHDSRTSGYRRTRVRQRKASERHAATSSRESVLATDISDREVTKHLDFQKVRGVRPFSKASQLCMLYQDDQNLVRLRHLPAIYRSNPTVSRCYHFMKMFSKPTANINLHLIGHWQQLQQAYRHTQACKLSTLISLPTKSATGSPFFRLCLVSSDVG